MTGNNFGYQSEEGVEKGAMGGGHQYSSQDSLPDSPYSSQSLDVQPLSEQGKISFEFDSTYSKLMPIFNPVFHHLIKIGSP